MEEKKEDKNKQAREEKIENLKAMQFMGNIHKLTPKVASNDGREDVAIIEALKSTELVTEMILELKGLAYDFQEKKFVRFRSPVMNDSGIGNFKTVISSISRNVEFSNFKEDEIPQIARYFFRINYPYFTIYHEDYELEKKDFNLVATMLFSFIIASLHKAKGGGHRNVVRGTYSEDLLGKITREPIAQQQRQSFDFSKLNPFKKPRVI